MRRNEQISGNYPLKQNDLIVFETQKKGQIVLFDFKLF